MSEFRFVVEKLKSALKPIAPIAAAKSSFNDFADSVWFRGCDAEMSLIATDGTTVVSVPFQGEMGDASGFSISFSRLKSLLNALPKESMVTVRRVGPDRMALSSGKFNATLRMRPEPVGILIAASSDVTMTLDASMLSKALKRAMPYIDKQDGTGRGTNAIYLGAGAGVLDVVSTEGTRLSCSYLPLLSGEIEGFKGAKLSQHVAQTLMLITEAAKGVVTCFKGDEAEKMFFSTEDGFMLEALLLSGNYANYRGVLDKQNEAKKLFIVDVGEFSDAMTLLGKPDGKLVYTQLSTGESDLAGETVDMQMTDGSSKTQVPVREMALNGREVLFQPRFLSELTKANGFDTVEVRQGDDSLSPVYFNHMAEDASFDVVIMPCRR